MTNLMMIKGRKTRENLMNLGSIGVRSGERRAKRGEDIGQEVKPDPGLEVPGEDLGVILQEADLAVNQDLETKIAGERGEESSPAQDHYHQHHQRAQGPGPLAEDLAAPDQEAAPGHDHQDQRQETKVCKKTLEPVWDEKFWFDIRADGDNQIVMQVKTILS